MRLLDISVSFHRMIRNGDLRMIRGSVEDRKIKEEKMVPSLRMIYDEVPLAILRFGTGPGRITQPVGSIPEFTWNYLFLVRLIVHPSDSPIIPARCVPYRHLDEGRLVLSAALDRNKTLCLHGCLAHVWMIGRHILGRNQLLIRDAMFSLLVCLH